VGMKENFHELLNFPKVSKNNFDIKTMKDFITNPHEKEICSRCRFEYLKSEFCRNCLIDNHAVEISHTWFENEDFRKFGIYDGINLGKLMDYDLRKMLFRIMAEIENEIKPE